jgi:hypothetical protein
MKSLANKFFSEKTFLGALVFFFILRVTYALTRDLFMSGPDAPNYAIAPLDFANNGFWSSQIQGAPYYPVGYPATLWPLVEIGGSNWIILAQIVQVFLSICTVYLVFKISQIYLGTNLSLIIGFIFLLSPAFTPVSGEAMYESVLMFVFYFYLYLILKSQNNFQKFHFLIVAGLMAGIGAVVHPRVIPWILAIQLILLGRLGYRRGAIFIGAFFIPIALFSIRSKVAYDTWALSTAANSWMNDIREGRFGLIFSRGFWNAVYFWSPYSGEAKRATWMHNFTFYHEIKEATNSTTFVIVLATIFALVSVTAWLFGSVLLLKSEVVLGAIVLSVPLLAWITDFLTAGDSRHRLVVMPLLLICQVTAYSWLYKNYRGNRTLKESLNT